ncbi:hypothetical protein VPH35_088686 [Triticum aestivum]
MPPPPLSLFSPAAVPKKAHTGGGSVPEKSCGDCASVVVGCSRGEDELGPPPVFTFSPRPCCLHGQSHVFFSVPPWRSLPAAYLFSPLPSLFIYLLLLILQSLKFRQAGRNTHGLGRPRHD